ncbi:MAG: PorT family protein [Nitrospirota bacterium]|nr:PorT family protein [Nitrospirota bacterium]MDH5744995.1 PorT family protein [Candidatus Aminicenantes bacterium]
MKKCLFIILIFIFASGAYAQQIKLIGGFNISSYSHWFPSERYRAEDVNFFRSPFRNSKTRFLAGIGTEFNLNDKIAIEIDVVYSQRGSTFTFYTPFFSTITEAYYMNGVSLPILVKTRFLPHPFPYIIGGGEFSIILSHSRKTIETGESGYFEIEENILRYTKRFDFGLVLGMGFEMKVSKVSCFLEGRYNLGQRNLLTSGEYYPYFQTIKTCSLQILAGFKI